MKLDKGIQQLNFAFTNRFYFPADQLKTCFELIFQKEIVFGLFVQRDC